MDTELVQAAAAVGVPLLGAVIWLIRLEGRINTHAALHDALKDDVGYIRSRIDAALNGHLK
jgi:hypothetical protein